MENTSDLPLELTVHGDLTVYGNLTVGGLRDAELSFGSSRLAALVLSEENIDNSNFSDSPSTPIRRKNEGGIPITSLALVAQKKERRSRGVELLFKPFHRSKILSSPEEGLMLYRCFPFKSQPHPHLLYSSVRDGPSIQKAHELIDGLGITAVLVQVGENRFGGFAASKWNSAGQPFGDEGCSFLFSLTHDAVIPYKGPGPERCQLFASPDVISFGHVDLVLQGDLSESSSVLENSYGVGWPEGGVEARTFLAGAEKFSPEQVEVWGFYTVD
jgi:hypothetical protein